jgi:peptidoglycan/LPS O-acetylase OafA/YrhL
MSRERINTLDGIRGVAILMVLAGHTAANYQPLGDDLRRSLEAFANASAGVRLFFVLSGYLITGLLLQEEAATGTISLKRFYGRRARRIFPAFYTYLLALALLNFWRPWGVNAGMWIAAATFTWNYALLWITEPPQGHWNLGHLWTLALEQQFYLFWPAALKRSGTRAGLWIALGLMVWCPIARVGTYFLFPRQHGMLGMMLHTGIDSLMAGSAAAILLRSETARARLRAGSPFVALAAVAWLFLASPAVSLRVHGFPDAAGFTLDAIAAVWIVAWVHHAPGPLTQRFLGRGLLPAIGLISYSLYLWQQIFLAPTGPLADGRVLMPLAASALAAALSYHLIEKRFLRAKPRRPREGQPAPQA